MDKGILFGPSVKQIQKKTMKLLLEELNRSKVEKDEK